MKETHIFESEGRHDMGILSLALWVPQSSHSSQQLLSLVPGSLGVVFEHLCRHVLSYSAEVLVDCDVRFTSQHDLKLLVVFAFERCWPCGYIDRVGHCYFHLRLGYGGKSIDG